MFEIILNAGISALITSLSIVLGYYVLTKKAEKMIKTEKILLKNDLEMWLNSEKGQKALYSIGAIIGNGAKAGIGIKTKSGKFKWQDLIGQVIGGYVQNQVLPNVVSGGGLLSGNSNPIKQISKGSTNFKIE